MSVVGAASVQLIGWFESGYLLRRQMTGRDVGPSMMRKLKRRWTIDGSGKKDSGIDQIFKQNSAGHGSQVNMKKEDGRRVNGQVPRGEILVYRTDDGKIKPDVRLERETLWMTQNDMAQLFQCSVDNISLHTKNIYSEVELTPSATTEEF
ncbi:MAG: hypothetical protein ACP5VS_12650 [Desulfomonilaceae bacterium]